MLGSDFDRGSWSLLILHTLKGGRLHGYAIGARIRDRTTGRLEIEEGVLYPALRKMEKQGWVQGEWGETETGRRARFYRLTRKGHHALRKKSASWEEHVDAVFAVLRD